MSQVFQRPRALAGECWWSDTRLRSFAFSSHSSLAVASHKGLRGVWVCDEEEKHQQLSINTRTYKQFSILSLLPGCQVCSTGLLSKFPHKKAILHSTVSFSLHLREIQSCPVQIKKQTLRNQVWSVLKTKWHSILNCGL